MKSVIDEHIAKFRAAIRQDPNDEKAHYGLGVAYYNLGLLDEAADQLAHAARLQPENPNIQTQLAVVLAESKRIVGRDRTAEAWDRVHRALRLDHSHTEALLLKGELQKRRGDPAGALATLRQVNPALAGQSARGLSAALLAQAQNELARRNYAGALAIWREVAASDPEAVRPAVLQFLDRHAPVLTATHRLPPQAGVPQPPAHWLREALISATVTAVVLCCVMTVIVSQLPEDANGEVDSSHPGYALFVIALLAFFIAPVAILISGFRRRNPPGGTAGTRPGADTRPILPRRDGPINDLLAAAERVMAHIERLPGGSHARQREAAPGTSPGTASVRAGLRRCLPYWASLASSVISTLPLMRLLIGQMFLASSAALRKVSSSTPGTVPVSVRCE